MTNNYFTGLRQRRSGRADHGRCQTLSGKFRRVGVPTGAGKRGTCTASSQSLTNDSPKTHGGIGNVMGRTATFSRPPFGSVRENWLQTG